MIATSEPPKKVWTEAELQSLPDDGFIHEVVDGELVMSPKNNFEHEGICTRLTVALEEFNRKYRLGVVRGSSAGYWMSNRNCRAPDISFVPKERLLKLGFSPKSRKFFPGAPDLAVEVLSPDNTRAEIDARLRDFFSSGTQVAWIINPDTESVEVCLSLTQRALLGPAAELDGEHLLPGFRYRIADLFKEWDWD
ncbi:MAG: Uma2 family endonuclease [Limisphaerales bacterium]